MSPRPSVPADRALDHVDSLISRYPGLSQAHFGRIAGLANGQLAAARRSGRISTEIEGRILHVTEDHLRRFPPPRVPTGLVRDHLARLIIQSGASQAVVAETAGVNTGTVEKVMRLTWPTVTGTVAAALYALTVDDLRREPTRTSREATVTRIRALQANGWALDALSAEHAIGLDHLVNGDPDSPILVKTAERVRMIYEAIGDRRGPSEISMARARALGYYPPIYYDDEMHFIEEEEDLGWDERQRARTALCILGLTLEGRTVSQIISVIGSNPRNIAEVRKRYGIAAIKGSADGTEVVEVVPGAFDAIKRAIRPIEYRSILDALDEPGVEYQELLDGILDGDADSRVA